MGPATRSLEGLDDVDVPHTLRLHRFGKLDPCGRLEGSTFALAYRTPDGAATLQVARDGHGWRAEAWGPGAARALDAAPALCGAHDDPSQFAPDHDGLRALLQRHRGMRMGRAPWVADTLHAVILQQRVTYAEAARAHRLLALRYGEPAPGPLGLQLPAPPRVLSTLQGAQYFDCGVDRQRANTLRNAARVARHVDALAGGTFEAARAYLTKIDGVGPWTRESVLGFAFGDADAVPVGDYWLPRTVAYALRGELDADDARMLELLEPFRPHRFRVISLIYAAGIEAPRRGPRGKPPVR